MTCQHKSLTLSLQAPSLHLSLSHIPQSTRLLLIPWLSTQLSPFYYPLSIQSPEPLDLVTLVLHKYNPILLAALLSHEHWYVSFVMRQRKREFLTIADLLQRMTIIHSTSSISMGSASLKRAVQRSVHLLGGIFGKLDGMQSHISIYLC